MNSRRTTHTIALVLIVVMVLPPMARAQVAARAENAVAAAVPAPGGAADPGPEVLTLTVGRSAIIHTDRPITRVSLSTPEIADAMVTTPREVLVHGKLPGTISLMIWNDNGAIKTYDVAVRRDLTSLNEQMRSVFPNETIKVAGNGKDVVLSGTVSSKYVVDRAAMLAVGYVDKPENVVNMIQQVTGVATNQVLLRVRFAEVSRSAVQELGAGFFTGAAGKGNWIGRSSTQQFPAPDFDQDKGLVFSDFLNLFAFNTEEQIGAVVKALKTKGLFQSLAEPNLITQDGKEASFLAGGEYPYPVIQSNSGNSAVTIVFKEFGVRLHFTPTVLADDMIHLKVAPEVSTLDFGNGLVLSGFRVPALSTRRTETEVELRDGQTFAIAGLLDNKVDETMRKIPGIGDIPILGYLFKSQAYNKSATELVVMITPHIVRQNSPGVTPNLPGLDQPFMATPSRKLTPPAPAFTGPQTSNTPAPEPVAAVGPTPLKPNAPVKPAVVAQTAPSAVVAPAPIPARTAAVAAKPVDTGASKADLKQQQIQLQQAQETARKASEAQRKKDEDAAKAEAVRAEQQRVSEMARARVEADQARKDEEKARIQAKADAQRQAKEQEQLKNAKKISDKRAEEQAVIDRKRMIEQQEAAARVKEMADKLSKEQDKQKQIQDKAAKEQADRDAELSKLVEQYKKLTTNVQ